MTCTGDFAEDELEIDNHILSAYKIWFNEQTFYLTGEEVAELSREEIIDSFCEQVKNRLNELDIKTI